MKNKQNLFNAVKLRGIDGDVVDKKFDLLYPKSIETYDDLITELKKYL